MSTESIRRAVGAAMTIGLPFVALAAGVPAWTCAAIGVVVGFLAVLWLEPEPPTPRQEMFRRMDRAAAARLPRDEQLDLMAEANEGSGW